VIASIHGQVLYNDEENLIIEVGGIGLQLFVTAPLRATLRIGEMVHLFTYLVVREDSLTLYGFETFEERSYFGLLLGVNGVGPRVALSVLSSMTPDSIRRAIFNEQLDLFSRVPGVGKKTAQKIILHLQDHIRRSSGIGDLQSLSVTSDVDTEVMNALIALGYSVIEAQTAVQSIQKDAPSDLEERLRLALQSMS